MIIADGGQIPEVVFLSWRVSLDPDRAYSYKDPMFQLYVCLFKAAQQTKVAPAVSMASISARSMRVRRNRAGSSLRSKYSPLAGATGPRELPETSPRPVLALPRGPCCCACCL